MPEVPVDQEHSQVLEEILNGIHEGEALTRTPKVKNPQIQSKLATVAQSLILMELFPTTKILDENGELENFPGLIISFDYKKRAGAILCSDGTINTYSVKKMSAGGDLGPPLKTTFSVQSPYFFRKYADAAFSLLAEHMKRFLDNN